MSQELEFRRAFFASGEFRLGAAAIFIILALVASYGQRILGVFGG